MNNETREEPQPRLIKHPWLRPPGTGTSPRGRVGARDPGAPIATATSPCVPAASPWVPRGRRPLGALEMAVALQASASAAFEMENKAAAGAERGPTASAGKSHPQRNKKHRAGRCRLLPGSAPAPRCKPPGDLGASTRRAPSLALISPKIVARTGAGCLRVQERPCVPQQDFASSLNLNPSLCAKSPPDLGDLGHGAPVNSLPFWVEKGQFDYSCGKRGEGPQWGGSAGAGPKPQPGFGTLGLGPEGVLRGEQGWQHPQVAFP